VGQHRAVPAPRRVLATRPSAALFGLALAGFGCDASVTSVGAWAPIASPEPASVYFEAESGELSGGYVVSADSAASGGQLIEPPLLENPDTVTGTARARYTFELPKDGDYVFWGRLYTPDVAHNRLWFQVDGGEWTLWRITVGKIWYWDDFHEDARYADEAHFTLTAGTHELSIANAVSGANIDRFYVTADGDEPPGNDTPCRPPHSIDMLESECWPSCGSQAPPGGRTTCIAADCEGRPPLFSYDCDVCCALP
jgi:hypothetical protein